mmetsp:Transcript_15111/g.45772  ORF Transcript_15111/g.45772 Transcript_15111/m.45772 type:complete len:237 (+) Transcript_15111:58-768(+)
MLALVVLLGLVASVRPFRSRMTMEYVGQSRKRYTVYTNPGTSPKISTSPSSAIDNARFEKRAERSAAPPVRTLSGADALAALPFLALGALVAFRQRANEEKARAAAVPATPPPAPATTPPPPPPPPVTPVTPPPAPKVKAVGSVLTPQTERPEIKKIKTISTPPLSSTPMLVSTAAEPVVAPVVVAPETNSTAVVVPANESDDGEAVDRVVRVARVAAGALAVIGVVFYSAARFFA